MISGDYASGKCRIGVVWKVEAGETGHSAQFSFRQLPDSTVCQWETPELGQTWTCQPLVSLSFTVDQTQHSYLTESQPPQWGREAAQAGGRSGWWDWPVCPVQWGQHWVAGTVYKTWCSDLPAGPGGGNFCCPAATCGSPARRTGWRARRCPGRESRRNLSGQTRSLSSWRMREWEEGEYKRHQSSCLSLVKSPLSWTWIFSIKPKCSIAFIRVLILIWLLIINSNDLRTYLRLQLSRNKVSMDSVCCQSSLWQSFGVWEDEGGPLCGELTPISRRNQTAGSHSYPLPSFIFTFLCLHLLMCHRRKNVWLLHFAEYHFTFSL